RHGERQADDARLDQIKDEMSSVGVGIAVADLDDEAGSRLVFCRLDQEWGGKMAGNDMCMHGVPKHCESLFHVELPECLAKLMFRTLGDIVHQHVQLSLLVANSRDELFNVLRLQMIQHHGNAVAAPSGHHLRSLF